MISISGLAVFALGCVVLCIHIYVSMLDDGRA